jgi:nicotinamidase-related amidase
MATPVVLVIDLQNDFFDTGPKKVGHSEKLFCVDGVIRLLGHARTAGWNIIHVLTEHDGPETMPRHLRHLGVDPYCVASTTGAEIIGAEGLYVPGERIVKKRDFNGFYGTELRAAIDGSPTIVIAGVASDCCVTLTAFEAARDATVYVPFQAVSASTQESYMSSLRTLNKSAATVVDLDELLNHSVGLADVPVATAERWADWYGNLHAELESIQNADTGPLSALDVLSRLRRSRG